MLTRSDCSWISLTANEPMLVGLQVFLWSNPGWVQDFGPKLAVLILVYLSKLKLKSCATLKLWIIFTCQNMQVKSAFWNILHLAWSTRCWDLIILRPVQEKEVTCPIPGHPPLFTGTKSLSAGRGDNHPKSTQCLLNPLVEGTLSVNVSRPKKESVVD